MWKSIIICSLAGLFYCYEYLLRISPNVIMNELMSELNISASSAGHLVACYYYAYTPAQLLAGLLLDRFGPGRILTLASFCCTIGAHLFSHPTTILVAELGRFLVGFGSAFAFIGVLKLASLWFEAKYFGLVTGLIITFGTFTAMLGNLVIAWLVELFHWQEALTLLALLGWLMTLSIAFIIKDPVNKVYTIKNQTSNDETAIKDYNKNLTKNFAIKDPVIKNLATDSIVKNQSSIIHSNTSLNLKSNMLELLKNLGLIAKLPQAWIIAFIGCLLYLPTNVFNELWGHSFLLIAHNVGTFTAASAISMTFLGWAIGAPLIGLFAEKLPKIKMLQYSAFLSLSLFCLILYGPTLHSIMLHLILFLFGLCSSPQILVLVIAKENCPKDLVATSLAFNNFVIMLGGMICQPLVSRLLDFYKSNQNSFITTQYTIEHYTLALSLLPVGLLLAFLLSRFCNLENKNKGFETELSASESS